MPWIGDNDSGPYDYTEEQKQRVINLLRSCRGRRNAIYSETAAAKCGLQGFTLRHILSDIDGVYLLVGYTGRYLNKVFMCEYAEEGEGHTRKIESQLTSETERVERRKGFAAGLPYSEWVQPELV